MFLGYNDLMSFGNFVDKMMGAEVKTCAEDDPRVLALVMAGVSDFFKGTLTPKTRLSEIGSQKDLQISLANLSSLYVRGSIAEDIIHDSSLGEVLTKLDAAKVEYVLAQLRKEEKRKLAETVHGELDSLSDRIS